MHESPHGLLLLQTLQHVDPPGVMSSAQSSQPVSSIAISSIVRILPLLGKSSEFFRHRQSLPVLLAGIGRRPIVTQEPFDFGRLYRVEADYARAHRSVSDAVDAIGLAVAAGAAELSAPDLAKTFTPNSGRHLRLRTVMGVGAACPPDFRRSILTPVAELFGFELGVARPMDDKEARIRLEGALRALGPIGEQALHAAYGGRR